MSNYVVAHYLDGRLMKGTCLDVDGTKPTLHILPPNGKAQEVKLAELKALFFVRSLVGNPEHEETKVPDPSDPRLRGSFLIDLRFPDGERVVGLTNRFPPTRPYFFIVPIDPETNNIRILVNRAAAVSMESPKVG